MAGDRGRAGAVDHQPRRRDVAARQVDGVDQPGGGDDGGPVLVVVEDRDVHQLAQALLDDEALGRLDVLEVDAAEGGPEVAHRVDEGVHLLGVHAQVDRIDVREALEQRRLAFHHRLRGQRAEIAETEDRRAVGDDGEEIALRRVVEGELGVAVDVQAGLGDARGIGQRQVARGDQRLGQADLQLAGAPLGMHGQRFLRRDPGRACVPDNLARRLARVVHRSGFLPNRGTLMRPAASRRKPGASQVRRGEGISPGRAAAAPPAPPAGKAGLPAVAAGWAGSRGSPGPPAARRPRRPPPRSCP